MSLLHLDLFSGIGGFALAADRAFGDVEHVFCEIDPFCQEVIKKHWPESKIYGDIRTLTNTRSEKSDGVSSGSRKEISEIRSCDLLTGGFPCQPFSQAGLRKGTDDNRYLWPEMFRIIREFKPAWVIAENVRGLVTWSEGLVLEQVCADLENESYEVQPFIIPAVAVNAPHRRDRIWFVAHRTGDRRIGSRPSVKAEKGYAERSGEAGELEGGLEGSYSDAQNSDSQRRRGRMESGRQILERQSTEIQNAGPDWERNWIEVATELCGVDDGLPRRLDRNPRLKALGNAIVPQVAEEIMKAIKML